MPGGILGFVLANKAAEQDAWEKYQKEQQKIALADEVVKQLSTVRDPTDLTGKKMVADEDFLTRFNHAKAEQRAAVAEGLLTKLKISDAITGQQRTQQIMQQSQQAFPTEQAQREATLEHTKKLTQDEGKVNVPGFGMMTPAQYSAHVARMNRMEELKKKVEPITHFENQLQNAYGLGIKDIVDAAQPQKFTIEQPVKTLGVQTGSTKKRSNGNAVLQFHWYPDKC